LLHLGGLFETYLLLMFKFSASERLCIKEKKVTISMVFLFAFRGFFMQEMTPYMNQLVFWRRWFAFFFSILVICRYICTHIFVGDP